MASCANLKLWIPKGIPTIVIHQNNPTIIDAIANSHPKNNIHNILSKKRLILLLYSMLLPKGYSTKPENLRHCIPIGMPITVIKQIIATTNHHNDRINPPSIIQKILPKIFIYAAAFMFFIGMITFSNTIAKAKTTTKKI